MTTQIDALWQLVENEISSVIETMEKTGTDVISPVYVANEVDKLLDPSQVSPQLKTYVSIMQLRQMARHHLAKRHDPKQHAQDYASGAESGDLFSDQLQEYYPAKREDSGGEKQRVYVKRLSMTDDEIDYNANRMSAAGESLQKHADALRAWKQSRAA